MGKPEIAPYLISDIDGEIDRLTETLADLKAQRVQAEQKESGAKRAYEAAIEILHASELTQADLFEYQRGAIRSWITKQAGEPDTIVPGTPLRETNPAIPKSPCRQDPTTTRMKRLIVELTAADLSMMTSKIGYACTGS